MGGKRNRSRKERVVPVAANPDSLGNNEEAGGGAQGAQGSSKICTSRESVSPLSRLIRGFRNKYHQIAWTRGALVHDAVRSGVHTRAQTLFGYFVSG